MIFGTSNNLEGTRAPELPDDLGWINSEPLTMKALASDKKVVLIDFWTYSCVNCIRTLPHIIEWDKKYRDKGLVIIGVHTPEFEFEKNSENVKRAIKDFGIEYPVVVDPDRTVWDRWSNNVWPRKLLVNPGGRVIYDHSGEGGYAESESVIQKALQEASGKVLKLPEIKESTTINGGSVCYPATPETYLGSDRGSPGQLWNVEGSWQIESEYAHHTTNTEQFNDYLKLNYKALSVNIVAQTSKGDARVRITLDDEPIPANMRGLDIMEEDGNTFMQVATPKMYSVISSTKFHEGSLKLYLNSDNLQLYVFTFSACEGVHV